MIGAFVVGFGLPIVGASVVGSAVSTGANVLGLGVVGWRDLVLKLLAHTIFPSKSQPDRDAQNPSSSSSVHNLPPFSLQTS